MRIKNSIVFIYYYFIYLKIKVKNEGFLYNCNYRNSNFNILKIGNFIKYFFKITKKSY